MDTTPQSQFLWCTLFTLSRFRHSCQKVHGELFPRIRFSAEKTTPIREDGAVSDADLAVRLAHA